MNRNFSRIIIGVATTAAFQSGAAQGLSPREVGDAYTITTTTRIAAPYDVNAMNDEFQSARLIRERDGVGTFEITYRPFHVQIVGSNPNWRRDDAKMAKYLVPRPAANWDLSLRARILSDLEASGIDPSTLDDRTLVQRVSSWAMRRSTSNDQFGLWMVEFRNGVPSIPSRLQQAFFQQEPKGVAVRTLLNRELFGKGMYLNQTHAACTSSATYLTTIFRAIGIPTRIILTVPACDPNDPEQIAVLTKAIRHHETAEAIKLGLGSGGFVNHVYNEVWVGKKWVRLNYDRLGQPILDSNYCGLMTHVYTALDISEIPFSKTWGERFALNDGPRLSSINPYQLLSAKDNLKPGIVLDNPVVHHLSAVTVISVLKPGDADLPAWAKLDSHGDAFFRVKEWIPGQNYMQMREFEQGASDAFTLTAPGQPEVTASLSGLNVSDEQGGFQAFAVKLNGKLAPGATYKITPHNEGHAHTWTFALGATWKG